MKKCAAIILVIGTLLVCSLAYAAEFRGNVTSNDGVTPVPGVPVYLYKYDAIALRYDYETSTTTDSKGAFTMTPGGDASSHLGAYMIYFMGYGSSMGDPFYYYYYYQVNPLTIYYNETYDDVTPLNPTKPPKQLVITKPDQVLKLALVKLNRKKTGLLVTGPITINKEAFTSFSYYGTGPELPAAGGTLSISFALTNLGSKAVSTKVWPLAFLSRRNPSALSNARSVRSFPSKSYTIPARSTKKVAVNVAVPAALMAATPPPDIYNPWAFNIGIQLVDSNVLANSTSSLILFPVLHEPTSSDALLEEAAFVGSRKEAPRMIPLKLSEDGKVIEWGPMPGTDD